MGRFIWLAAVVVGMATAPRVGAQTGTGTTVRCESRGSDREQCAIPAGSRVELAQHLSSTPCKQNSNWGYGQAFIWVSAGCRAEFSVTAAIAPPVPPTPPYPSGPGNTSATPMQLRACRSEADRRMPAYSYDQIQVEPQARQGSTSWVRWWAGNSGGTCTVAASGRILAFTTDGAGGPGGGTLPGATRITCESKSTARQQCAVPSGARIRLVRQLSQNPCRLNDTYGQGASYVWVAEGCRGEFEVTQAQIQPPVGGGGGVTILISCQSIGINRRECPIASGASARLISQTAGSCVLNQTYGVAPDHIWVARGCGGRFEVRQYGQAGGTGPGGLPSSPGLAQQITCESKELERTTCIIRSGAQVQLVRQLSTSPCTRNSTWGTGGNTIWVSKGCRAEFAVR